MDEVSVIAETARANPHADPQELASRVRQDLGEDDILALVAAEIARVQRSYVRSIEHDVLDALFMKGGVASPIVVSGGDPLRLLFGQKLSLGDGLSVLVEDMTLEQWTTRRTMLEAQRQGLDRAIEICRLAEERIRNAGVDRLSEILQAA